MFDQNHGLTPLEKCQFFGFLKPMFTLFLRFILAIYDMGIQGVTRGNWGLQGVTGDYKGLQGVTIGYKGLQGVTRG